MAPNTTGWAYLSQMDTQIGPFFRSLILRDLRRILTADNFDRSAHNNHRCCLHPKAEPRESKIRRKPKEMEDRARTPVTPMVSNICKQPQQNQRITAAPYPYPIETKRLPCRDRNQGGGVSKPGKTRKIPAKPQE